MTIVIDGHSYDYTGTNHRLLLLRVYADAIAHAGWFGFGTPKVSGDTTHVPFVEDQLRSLFASIDNHYVQFVLQAGYLGVGLFVVLGAVSAGYLLPPALAIDHRRGLLAAGLFGAIVATMFSLMTVWLSRDFSFFWLLLVGVAGAWRSEILTERAMSLARRPTNVLQRRLVPGHALPIAAPG